MLGLEVSRPGHVTPPTGTASSEICALADTLILDEDGVYDPAHFNDRLLLGAKRDDGVRPELHIIKATAAGRHSQQSQTGRVAVSSAGSAFSTAQRISRCWIPTNRFSRVCGSSSKTFRPHPVRRWRRSRHSHQQGLLVSASPEEKGRTKAICCMGGGTGTIAAHCRYSTIRGTPGPSSFPGGHTRTGNPDGGDAFRKQPRDQWILLPQYASPDTVSVGAIRGETSAGFARTHRRTAMIAGRVLPREGPALLQGLVLCGVCGSRMDSPVPLPRHAPHSGLCLSERRYRAWKASLSERQRRTDRQVHIGDLLIQTMTPIALDLALTVRSRRFRSVSTKWTVMRCKQVERRPLRS